jgi:uncharacterized protein (TIGR02246 family)
MKQRPSAEKGPGLATVADEQQIRQVMDEWRRLTAEGNLDGLLSLLSDDVVFLTPGNPPITKNDFAAGFQKVSAKARIEATQDVKEIRTSGDIATAWSHLTVVLTPKDGGKTSEASGYVLTVFHRSPSGNWLLARDANLVAGVGNPDRV